MSKEFLGLSELLLGQTQPNQFQSSSDEQPTGWTWGSIYNESGDTIGTDSSCSNKSSGNTSASYASALGRCVENNSRAEMPRAYHEGNNSYGDYYNWFAATAESGTFDQTSGGASDSLCPAGWQLPVNGSSDSATDKSWRKLLFNTTGGYGLSNNAESSQTMRQIPLSIPFSGLYYWPNGNLNLRGSYGSFWSSTVLSNTNAYYLGFYSAYVYPQTHYDKVYGFTVRCVIK